MAQGHISLSITHCGLRNSLSLQQAQLSMTTRCCSTTSIRSSRKVPNVILDHNKNLIKDPIECALPEYEAFHARYNTSLKDKCNIDQLMAQCVYKEERLKSQISDSINLSKLNIPKQNKNSKNGSRIRSSMITRLLKATIRQFHCSLTPTSTARRWDITIESAQNSCSSCYRKQFKMK
jgi:hypothetical protein